MEAPIELSSHVKRLPLLQFSIFKQKESHQSFDNIKAGGNQTAIIIAQIHKLICNLILASSIGA